MNVDSVQVGGDHYKNSTYQHWDFVRNALEGRYLEGNITKYLARWRKKNGVQDLRKARHYIDKLRAEYAAGNVTPLYTCWHGEFTSPAYFCATNDVDTESYYIIVLVSNWTNDKDLEVAASWLDRLIAEQEHAAEPGAGYVNQD